MFSVSDPSSAGGLQHRDVAMATTPGTTMVAASQSSTQVINSMHMDYIHKVAFDTYGRRMATCSGDRFVRVWDLTDQGTWTLTAQWQAHRGSVTSLCWAHPEFGSLLATCGSDQEAKIWEERNYSSGSSSVAVGGTLPTTTTTTTTTNSLNSALAVRWNVKASLTEARRTVTCLEFAPRHWGLKLAVGSADGCVRIYEAVDIMNLAQWPLAASLQSFAEGSKLGCTSLGWCTGRFEPPTLVAGGSHLVIFRYSDTARAWQPILQLPAPKTEQVLDVAWAPNVGRRFHYIASAEGDALCIYKLSRDSNSSSSTTETTPDSNNAKKDVKSKHYLSLESVQSIDTNAWRCQWNVTGTVLASSGDAGIVQMFKADRNGKFQCVAEVNGDLTQVVGGGGNNHNLPSPSNGGK